MEGVIFMKMKIVIEEVISQEFEVEVSSIDTAFAEIEDMYKSGKLVLDDAQLVNANAGVPDDDGNLEWDSIYN